MVINFSDLLWRNHVEKVRLDSWKFSLDKKFHPAQLSLHYTNTQWFAHAVKSDTGSSYVIINMGPKNICDKNSPMRSGGKKGEFFFLLAKISGYTVIKN